MKRWIKFLSITGIIIILLSPIFGLANEKYGEEEVLEGVLKELGGDYLEGDVNMGGIILDEFLEEDEMVSLGKDIKSKMKIVDGQRGDLEYVEEFIDEKGFKQLTIYGYDLDENPVTILMGSYIEPYNNTSETSLFINLIKRGQNFNINGIIDNMEEVFKDFHKPVELTTCVIGTLEEDILEESIIKAMEKFKLQVVEEYIDESIISYTAYTPLIDNSIYSGRKQVNFNLAIRYNENEDKNYIWIGTPIITTGY